MRNFIFFFFLKFEKKKINKFYLLSFRCPPCRKLGEFIESNYKDDKDVTIVKIDCDKAEKSIANSHSVRGIPAVYLYIDG
jgi:thioredoxin-like negative regulator of GroEL